MKIDTPQSLSAADNKTLAGISLFFLVLVGVAAVLALAILFLPGTLFLALSNYLQILAALGGSLVFLYAWRQSGGREAFLYAAGGFGLWAISNIAWYASVFLGQRAMVFPSLIDIGMIASFLVLAIAFRKGLPETPVPSTVLYGILAFCLIIPGIMTAVAGVSASTVITFAYFVACGAFLMTGLRHSLAANPGLLAGSVLFAASFMIYPVREMFFVENTVLPVIGPFVAAGFSLMVTGWLSVK